jgi:hypothetical protein
VQLNATNAARELRNHYTLVHPNIVGFKRALVTPGKHLCIVMELCEKARARTHKSPSLALACVWCCSLVVLWMTPAACVLRAGDADRLRAGAAGAQGDGAAGARGD